MRNYQYFSVEALSQSVGGTNTELGARILRIFIEYLDDLQTAIDTPRTLASDWQPLADSAHRYKTSAKSIGSDIIASKLDELEHAIDNSQLDHAIEIAKELPHIIVETKSEINHFLGNQEGAE